MLKNLFELGLYSLVEPWQSQSQQMVSSAGYVLEYRDVLSCMKSAALRNLSAYSLSMWMFTSLRLTRVLPSPRMEDSGELPSQCFIWHGEWQGTRYSKVNLSKTIKRWEFLTFDNQRTCFPSRSSQAKNLRGLLCILAKIFVLILFYYWMLIYIINALNSAVH